MFKGRIEATEVSTRTGAINEQAQAIKDVQRAKTQEQETQKGVDEQ